MELGRQVPPAKSNSSDPRYVNGTSKFGLELGVKFHQRNRNSNESPTCQWNFEIRIGTWGQVPPAKSEFQWVPAFGVEMRSKFHHRNWSHIGSTACHWNCGIRSGAWGQVPSAKSEFHCYPPCVGVAARPADAQLASPASEVSILQIAPEALCASSELLGILSSSPHGPDGPQRVLQYPDVPPH